MILQYNVYKSEKLIVSGNYENAKKFWKESSYDKCPKI